jgi:hypothetical protein
LIGGKNYKKVRKAMIEKNRLFEIVIPLNLNDARLSEWIRKRKTFMSRMVRGHARRKSE